MATLKEELLVEILLTFDMTIIMQTKKKHFISTFQEKKPQM